MLRNGSITPVRIKLSLDIASRSAMRNLVWIILLVAAARAEEGKYKLCAPSWVENNACFELQRGEVVSCLHVTDSAECAIRINEGNADFGIFNAEELLLAHQIYPSNLQPILQLRHNERQQEEYEFQMVAVVPADLTSINLPIGERLKRLKNGGFCHPGFSKSQWINDYILKYFENLANPQQCHDDVTAIENEIRNLKNFFGKACRPGEWASDASIDEQLKRKYPELCALCDDKAKCKYRNENYHGHYGALECLARGNGKVAYVAHKHVQDYLGRNDSFQFLCPSGYPNSVLPLSTENPCVWFKQPWGVVVAKKEIANSLKTKLLQWIRSPKEPWKIALRSILQRGNSQFVHDMEETSTDRYLQGKGEIDVENIRTCGKPIRWCTIGDLETDKCKWVAKEAKALGVAPSISCLKSNSTFECFRNIKENRTDIIVIDSNYGFLARSVYDLSTVLFSETEAERNSVILAVIREPRDDNYPIKSWHDLKNKKACFPEYGGISWLSFISAARTSNAISSKSCDYPLLVSRLLSGACTPGIEDSDHSHIGYSVPSDIASKLCSSCKHQNNTSCGVNGRINRYFGDKGAMRCLIEGAGNIAFIEKGNLLDDNNLDRSMYRVLCKNGSLAQYLGFDVSDDCALSVTIDSELIGRKKDATQISRTDTILALLKLENWLGYRSDVLRPIDIYGPFNGTPDLLFKDSTTALIPTSSTKNSVVAYKELFSHVEKCTNGSSFAAANFIFIAVVALYHLLSSHVH